MMNDIPSAALRYTALGYSVFPCVPGESKPVTKHGFKDATTDTAQIEAWWARWPNANIGIPTAGLIVIDIDGADNLWLADDPDRQAELASVVSLTPRGGRHHVFRQPEGKNWRNTTGRVAPKVDTRADGGYIVVPPSVRPDGVYRWAPGFELLGNSEQLPEPPEWLVEILDALQRPTSASSHLSDTSYSSDAERRALAYLDAMPHAVSGNGGHNATYAAAVAMIHGFGIPKERVLEMLHTHYNPRCEPPWSDKELQHKVDDAASKPHDRPFGWLRDSEVPPCTGVDISELVSVVAPCDEEPAQALIDPGPLPEELLRIPGFISEVMDYVLDTAPYPNTVMAFSGALALQAFLAGRKVRDPGDNRTNIYILGLAHSAAGKDWPRKVNTRILHQVGQSDCLGERFASGEGVQDALFLKPSMLFQTDEIDGMLQSINKAKDARHENVMSTLLTLYSSSNSVFPMRKKAGNAPPRSIDQPCLVIFGTAIPNHYYTALSERMLTNGFFARNLILESGPRPKGQEPKIINLHERILATAKWWSNFKPGTGNLEDFHPEPRIVEHSDDARRILIETREQADAEYAEAEEKGDPVGTTVWGRVSEQTRKLALIYAVSENYESPLIGLDAATWATRFVMHQTRRMLFMAQSHVADNPFHADCLKFLEKLRNASNRQLPHSVLLKRMKIDARTFQEIVNTLEQRSDIQTIITPRAGTPLKAYRLLSAGGERW